MNFKYMSFVIVLIIIAMFGTNLIMGSADDYTYCEVGNMINGTNGEPSYCDIGEYGTTEVSYHDDNIKILMLLPMFMIILAAFLMANVVVGE